MLVVFGEGTGLATDVVEEDLAVPGTVGQDVVAELAGDDTSRINRII